MKSWKTRTEEFKIELVAVYLAYKDPRVPLYARIFATCVVGYAFSPIDLIPDFIPVIGYLDDLIIVPLGVFLAIKMIPQDVLAECREKAEDVILQRKPVNRIAAGIVVTIWLVLVGLSVVLLIHLFRK